MKRLSLILVIALLSGCSLFPRRVEVQRVEIPVQVPCNAPEVSRPSMAFDDLAKTDKSLYENVSLLLAQNYNLKGYATQLEAAVSACRNSR